MKKIGRIILFFLSITQLHAQVPDLEKAKRKYFQANVISYKETASSSNPETKAIFVTNVLYTIYKPQNKDFEFYSKNESSEEFYKNGLYYHVNHTEKTIYEYENKNNQKAAISSSRLRQFGPTTLLKKNGLLSMKPKSTEKFILTIQTLRASMMMMENK